MDIISILKDDHKKVHELFSQIEETSSRASKSREKLFEQLKTEVTLHALAEEQCLYPRLKDVESLKHYALESYEEHRLVKQLFEELSEIQSDDEEFLAKCKVAKDLFFHHVKEEEGEIFKEMKSEFDKDELKELGQQVLEFKQDAMAGDNSTKDLDRSA